MCDKGEGEKRRDDASCLKLVSRFNKDKERVKGACIGIQSAGDFSIDVAQGVDYGLKLYDSSNHIIIMQSMTSIIWYRYRSSKGDDHYSDVYL